MTPAFISKRGHTSRGRLRHRLLIRYLVVPATIKIGDVEVKLQQARESGAVEGRVKGLAAGAAISERVAAGDLPVDQVETA